jgi:ATP-binding cassette subfamily E protein 1
VAIVDIEDMGKKARISASFCIGCGICVKKCPFNAISIVNLPKRLSKEFTLYSYGENAFRVYGRPSIKKGSCVGLLGSNGLGKSTILKVLSGDIKIDLTDKTLKKLISGNEMFKYVQSINASGLEIAYKPQDVMMFGKVKKPVKDIIKRIKPELIERFQLDKLSERRLKDLSGGEIQRLMICKVCSMNRDSYLFDEPAAFLDIRQRIRACQAISNLMIDKSPYVVCIEHDLCVLDYVCDYVTCLYGETSCYGVITGMYGTFEGINNYLAGYFKKENIKFRPTPITFNLSAITDEDTKVVPSHVYSDMTIKYDEHFQLDIMAGDFNENEIVLLIGENGTGKSSFIKMIAGDVKTEGKAKFPKLVVSHKEQNPYIEFDGTVRQLLEYKVNRAMCDSTFTTSVLRPLKITNLMDDQVSSLSGGQMQKLSIALCLGAPADVYLLDEPSAYIDVDDRLYVAKIIKQYTNLKNKTTFLVEHDIIMATSISDRVIVFDGEPGIACRANTPQPLQSGINQFLKSINVTMRKDTMSRRPRINKIGGNRDTEQKKAGNYFLIE